MFQPDGLDQLFAELEGRKALHQAFGEAVYHANRLHEDAIRELKKRIQSMCIHPEVKHTTWTHPHKGEENDEYKCLVCEKESDRPLK